MKSVLLSLMLFSVVACSILNPDLTATNDPTEKPADVYVDESGNVIPENLATSNQPTNNETAVVNPNEIPPGYIEVENYDENGNPYKDYLPAEWFDEQGNYIGPADYGKSTINNGTVADASKAVPCADKKVKYAVDLQKRSKDYLHDYYRNRRRVSLYYSWYALQDSNYVLEQVQFCSDKTNKHFYAVNNLKEQNERFTKYIAINGRKQSYRDLGELYLEDYDNIFPRDIK